MLHIMTDPLQKCLTEGQVVNPIAAALDCATARHWCYVTPLYPTGFPKPSRISHEDPPNPPSRSIRIIGNAESSNSDNSARYQNQRRVRSASPNGPFSTKTSAIGRSPVVQCYTDNPGYRFNLLFCQDIWILTGFEFDDIGPTRMLSIVSRDTIQC